MSGHSRHHFKIYYLARDGNRVYQFEDKGLKCASIGHAGVRMDEVGFL